LTISAKNHAATFLADDTSFPIGIRAMTEVLLMLAHDARTLNCRLSRPHQQHVVGSVHGTKPFYHHAG
jgi:hypothetical protein